MPTQYDPVPSQQCHFALYPRISSVHTLRNPTPWLRPPQVLPKDKEGAALRRRAWVRGLDAGRSLIPSFCPTGCVREVPVDWWSKWSLQPHLSLQTFHLSSLQFASFHLVAWYCVRAGDSSSCHSSLWLEALTSSCSFCFLHFVGSSMGVPGTGLPEAGLCSDDGCSHSMLGSAG